MSLTDPNSLVKVSAAESNSRAMPRAGVTLFNGL